ncbi:radical SAM family heme chaperone HemW [Sulfurospirillum deleyianum]|uniref:Heme chaperone HemW n=1 Tax=Sulfurospirillum deleyianum (strain ATCC 51133 / DSM 6946 / 5175) TaxID=525898 RepID=D1B2S9_SULD5|nr:radical SAM family heme chaperone HemW [Sulfurospirillum deleyianum]ACZ12399.1 oxygen-independent coproporphyrinogen III oxidase [Sulfurospirillum deleyianum DSM 6946]
MLAYMHIPFCDSKCPYCAFNSYTNQSKLKQTYMQRLIEQLRFELEKFNVQKGEINSLFIGGGTPSTIPASWYAPLFEMLSPYLSKEAELTSEANPHSATQAWIAGMKELGINRLSFGVQSFNTEKLQFLGRNHSPKMAEEAIINAHHLGIQNISLDLMYGTALDTPHLLREDLKYARMLPINHLSAYALTLEEETPFYTQKNVINSEEALARTFVQEIIDAGFPQYEISNFGSYESYHNKGYWEHQDYLGLGAGAVGFLHHQRFYPAKKVEDYLQNPCYQAIEELSIEELHVEKIFLGLRSCVGIDRTILNAKEEENVALLLQENKLTCKNNRLYNKDYFLSDELALFITR